MDTYCGTQIFVGKATLTSRFNLWYMVALCIFCLRKQRFKDIRGVCTNLCFGGDVGHLFLPSVENCVVGLLDSNDVAFGTTREGHACAQTEEDQ